ncbi:MAG: hypothetical protein Q9M36_13235 [Sulfurovum sp.]|nr:hypothetical protein [Sulfurovum sp.]
MNIKSYLDLYQLVESDNSSKESRRAFGLSQPLLVSKPLSQLMLWLATQKEGLIRPLFSETFSTYLYGMTFTVVLIAFILGIFSGMALLHYNGQVPVNIVYFMAVVIVLPLLTMFLSIFSMFKVHKTQSILLHISPAYWMEKILLLFLMY